jgi:hypothetical protein
MTRSEEHHPEGWCLLPTTFNPASPPSFTLPLDMTWYQWLIAITAVLITGIAKSGFGGGIGIVAVPLFTFAMGPVKGVGTLLPLLVASDIFAVAHHWKKWDARNLRVLLPGSVLGTLLGMTLMSTMKDHPRELEFAIGLIAVLYVILDYVRNRFAPHWHLTASYPTGTITGASAGIVSYIAHAAGPVIAIFLLGQRLAKSAMVGTSAIYFLILNSIKIPPYVYQNLIDTPAVIKGLWLVPFVPLGTFIGARLHHGLSERVFRRVILCIVALSGVQMIIGMKTVLHWLGL